MSKKIRYAVVGLGHIAQVAVLPAFKTATNSELSALVSGDDVKLRTLGKRYKAPYLYSYDELNNCLRSGNVDAVYICLPNHLHAQATVMAAERGIHVLCEKPMALNEEQCMLMMEKAQENNVKLMVAYRLHFEKANLEAVKWARSGKLGDLRAFNSVFTMQVKDPDNIRLKKEDGGGTLWDIGIYCINASRYLFGEEPQEAIATTSRRDDKRFTEVEEMSSCILKFPDDRMANFVCSFGAADRSEYEIVGTKGSLRLKSAYDYAEGKVMDVTIGNKTKTFRYPKCDQFAAELVYFSECILRGKNPEPSATEGMNDVKIIQALYKSAQLGQSVGITNIEPPTRPTLRQQIYRKPHSEPPTVHVASPH